MKRIRSRLTTVLAGVMTLFGLSISRVYAQIGIQPQNPTTYNSIEDVVNALLGLVRPIIVLTLLGILTYAGYVYLTAGDSDDKVGKARKMIVAAIIGFIIIIVAPAIVQFVGALFGVRDGILGL